MPVAINSSPPPPPPSTGPNGPSPINGGIVPRTTTTSRRGGRTRSRSPPVMGGRMSSPFPATISAVNGENPSSAAAAAAAAAKAYSNGQAAVSGGAGRHWPDHGGRDDPAGGGNYHGGYDKHYHQGPPTRNWPSGGGGVGGDDTRSAYRYPADYHQGYSNARYRDDRYHDERYRDVREQYYDERGQPPPPPPPPHHHRGSRGGPYPVDYRYSHGRPTSHRTPHGGASLVIGGATPVHVPKMSAAGDPKIQEQHRPAVEQTESRSSSRHRRRGTAESVFRGRPGDTAPVAPAGSGDRNDSTQKILLSLRTPSASFEEKDAAAGQKKELAAVLGSTEKSGDVLAAENRSPDDSKNSGSIETAPSFSLFNQSFDSFGDGHYFNVDSTLQNDSFGMGRIASVDPDTAAHILQSPSANFSQQLLATNSGALTLGYSPVNSFGNISAVNGQGRRSGNTMVVGGVDPSNSSPTQPLVYQSYSNGGPRAGPLDDSHLRMSVGSFGLGATSLPYSRSYGEGPTNPSSYYSGHGRALETADGTPSFYSFLARHKSAFKDCSFLLPGLKVALLESPISDKEGSSSPIAIENGSTDSQQLSSTFGEPFPQDIAIARRRIESSIFAFGGNPHSRHNHRTKKKQDSSKSSIFRSTEEDSEKQQHSATITPGSTASTNEFHQSESRSKSKYEDELSGRYYENESRLSWEFEEAPPVEISPETDDPDDDLDADSPHSGQSQADGRSNANGSDDGKSDNGDKRQSAVPSSPQPKMRYRCKLCGQPKQNHTCPYQQSLARSIGVMVFPSVNAFTANEPGALAPPLTEMNNFFDLREPGSNDSTPSRPSPDRMRSRMPSVGQVTASTHVTPESMRSSPRHSLHSPTPSYATTPAQTPSRQQHATSNQRNATMTNSGSRKRSYATLNGTPEERDLLFLESMELKAEQFRIVTPSKVLSAPDAFCYPSLPLPYAQRKRLSDNLFALSNEVPKLTDECAQVLREAREKDMWDLAVAELMTQVIVIIHCPDGDARFDGLRQYLLTLGIAC